MNKNATQAAATGGAGISPKARSRAKYLGGPRTEAWRRRLVNATLIGSDLILALFVWEVACVIQMFWAPGYLQGAAVLSIVPVALAWVGIRGAQGLYPGYGMNEAEELRRQTYALLTTLAVAAVFALAFHVGDAVSRFLLLLVFSSLLFLSPIMRHLAKQWMGRRKIWGKPALILGAENPAARLEELLTREWALGFKPVATFHAPFRASLSEAAMGDEGAAAENALADAVMMKDRHGIDTLLIALPVAQRGYAAKLANLASLHFKNVVIFPELTGVGSSEVVARDFRGTLGIELRHSLLSPSVQRAKRSLELALTVVGGIFILPLFLALAALVWVESRGGVFYKDKRMGRNGKLFSCMKFRTMVPDAEEKLQKILAEDPEASEEYRKFHKLRNDPRVTRVGRFLRKTSLDELPQLINVIRGEMSLVGPRPYLPRESDDIGIEQGEILRVYPGITGPWQVGGRSKAHFDERVGMDAHYVRNWSIWLDFVILTRTARTLILDRSAY